LTWFISLSKIITFPVALFIIAGLAYIPGYINAFTVISLLFDKQPSFKTFKAKKSVTILIACYNEEETIEETLKYIDKQSYTGEIKVIVIDNNSIDNTYEVTKRVCKNFGMDIMVIKESKIGKHHALNAALKKVNTPYTLTVDADTLLMPSSLDYLMARMVSCPPNVCAVAGVVLARNGRKTFWTRIQEWDYFLGIASIKRLQGMYQGTLVAQGAFSVYKTNILREIGGYPDVIGEDIVITWKLLSLGYTVYFEPLAVSFTNVPETFRHFQKQRSRWSRGMLEAIRSTKPWRQPNYFVRFATSLNLIMPFLDFVYAFVFIPGLILACFGYTWVVGLLTLLVLPLALLQNYLLYRYQKSVFKKLNLRVRRNTLGFILYVLLYQAIMSPISLYGYLEEFLSLKRVWK
jgi:biofilm PGA synthesis N-glycosyltransferase PgaC